MPRAPFLDYAPPLRSEADKLAAAWLDPEVFVFELCRTYDETDAEHPVKPFPRHAYLRNVIAAWRRERLLAIVKSRRLVITWLLCALDLWQAMTQDYASIYIAAK